MRSWAGSVPRLPAPQARSVKRSTASGSAYRPASTTGTRGARSGPGGRRGSRGPRVTTRTSGASASIAGSAGVQPLERRHLAREVPVLPGLVGVLVVEEHEVVGVPVGAQRGHLVGEGAARLEDVHADQAREPPVHGVGGDRRGPEPVHLREAGSAGRWSKPRSSTMLAGAASARRGRASATNRLTRSAVAWASGACACTGRGGRPRAWGSVSDRRPDRPGPRSTRTNRCSLTGSTRISAPGTRIRRRRSTSAAHRSVGIRPARRSVMRPVVVDGAEVTPGGDVAGPEVEVDPERLQDAAPHRVAKRLVAEEAEVPGAAARGDAGGDVAQEAAGAPPGQRVQVGDPRGLQLGAGRWRDPGSPPARPPRGGRSWWCRGWPGSGSGPGPSRASCGWRV